MVYNYPAVRRDETIVENLHGVSVADPYRWLENPDSEETKSFVDAENVITDEYLSSYPHKEKFREHLTKTFDFERYSCPFKKGDFYYYFHNTGLQPQSVLYQQESLTAQPKVFFDPNTLEADGTASLSTYGFSKSGKWFAYGISKSGSDWVTVYVKPTTDHTEHTNDQIEWIKFSGLSFTHDDAGFLYTRYPKPEKADDKGTETDMNLNSQIYYHRLGTPQSEDILIHKDPENPEYMFGAKISEDGRYLLIDTSKDCDPVNKLWLADLSRTNGKVTGKEEFIKLVDNFEAEYEYIMNDGTLFYFKTNLKSPRYKVIKYDLAKPEEGFSDLVPEHPVDVLSFAKVVNQSSLITAYMHDVKEVISLHDLSSGKLLENLDVPIGSIESITGRKEDTEFFFKFSGFLNPGIIYRYNFPEKSMSIFRTTVVEGLNTDNLETKQVFIESKDGTRIPIFIVSRKNITLNANNPTMLYGYGGFNIPITPYFSPVWINFVLHYGGVLVVANIRGGGEYGEDWHKAGMLANKQNVFDDFQSVAKWLIAEKYTSPSKLSINGGSNGGLLVGACINQAPELFGAAVADVGVMDMLRYHKFTIGYAWKSDYGDPDKKEDFEYIYKYSPLHNVQTEKPYPPVMLTTSDHDDRVVPLHSYKYIAALQHAVKDNPNPLLIRIETKAGHGSGKPTKKRIDEGTDRITFIALATGAEWVD